MTQRAFPAIALLMMAFTLPAQPVSFNFQSPLLNPAAAINGYADCAVDMNGDYRDDVVRIAGKGIYIDYQQPDGSFSQQFFTLPIQLPPSWSICAGDLDNNGFNDLLFANTAGVSFVKANATGSGYVETPMPVGLFSQRSTLFDINGDGWLDGFVCDDLGQSVPFRNLGSGEMKPDTSLLPTSDRPGNYSAIWVDYDNDGDADLYLTKCEFGAPVGDPDRTNLLYRNNGDGSFTEVGEQAGLADNAQSWSTSFEDFDNDGDFDAFVINHDFHNRLFRNNGDGTFTDVIDVSGLGLFGLGALENAAGDFNNDGFVDIFTDLSPHLFLGHGDLTFTPQTVPPIPGALADLNDDGFLDVYHQGNLWMNAGNALHWLKVNSRGLAGNRNGIGARIEIYGAWGRQLREVRSGQSYSPMNTLTTHFGLGAAQQVDSLVVRWPSGIVTRLYDLTSDTTYLVPEAPCLLPAVTLALEGDTAICPGDTVRLFPPAGYAGYEWSTGDTLPFLAVSQEGAYSVALRDSQHCLALSNTVTIARVKEVLPAISALGTNHICAGDTLLLTASPGTGFQWSNGADSSVIAVTASGAYTVSVDAQCGTAPLVSAPYPVVVLPRPQPPLVTGGLIGMGDSLLLEALADSAVQVYWYGQGSGGSPLHIGPTFQTPPLDSNAVYYAESQVTYSGSLQSGGKADNAGLGGVSNQVGYLIGQAWEPFRLLSVTVYVPANAPAGVRFIQLYSGDMLLASKQFTVQTGVNVLELDFDVPVGIFSLRCPQGNLFRNIGNLDYPYALGGAGRVLTSSLGDFYYYYFYDWKMQTPGYTCVSERVPAEVVVTGTEEISGKAGWRIFPNPASGQVFLDWENGGQAGGAWLRIVDALGQEVRRQRLPAQGSVSLNLEGLPGGIYGVQVWQGGFFGVKKLWIK